MKRLAIILALGFALVPAAEASRIAYRSDHQAENYLEHGLKRWQGVDLTTRKYKFRVAFCLTGARSKYEKTHAHFPEHKSASGDSTYHTFTCTLAAANKVWHLYLVALPNGSFSMRTDL
ncbi:MAG: hypothetical protein QOH95_2025 [Gaiellaceae bacterium]|jgi:hypothetical protein|nr:hypothetical protein [Gaiellaceae bacterium]